jgi:hypothetical protein
MTTCGARSSSLSPSNRPLPRKSGEVTRWPAPAVVAERREPTRQGLGWTAQMTGSATTPAADAVTRRSVARTVGLFERWRRHNDEEAGRIAGFLAERSAQEVG